MSRVGIREGPLSAEKSLNVFAYNLKQVMKIIGTTDLIALTA